MIRRPRETAPVIDLEAVQLARRARQDPRAAEAIMDQVLPRVRHAVFRLVGPSPEAPDLVNTCLVGILEGLGKYRGEASLRTWADRVAIRVAMRHLKRQRRRERTVRLDPEPELESGGGPIADLTRKRLAHRLEKHLAQIPPERRATVVLRLVLGHSVTEVAEITQVPLNTARDRIRVALRELRSSIAQDPALVELLAEVPRDRS